MRCGSSPPCAPSSSTLEADNRLAERRTWPDLSLPSCVLVSIDELFHVGTRGAVFCFKSGRHSSAVRLDAHGSLGARGSYLPHNTSGRVDKCRPAPSVGGAGPPGGPLARDWASVGIQPPHMTTI